jgi:hypothetical protein
LGSDDAFELERLSDHLDAIECFAGRCPLIAEVEAVNDLSELVEQGFGAALGVGFHELIVSGEESFVNQILIFRNKKFFAPRRSELHIDLTREALDLVPVDVATSLRDNCLRPPSSSAARDEIKREILLETG